MRALANRRFGAAAVHPLAAAPIPVTRSEIESEIALATARQNGPTISTADRLALVLRISALQRALDTLTAEDPAR